MKKTWRSLSSASPSTAIYWLCKAPLSIYLSVFYQFLREYINASTPIISLSFNYTFRTHLLCPVWAAQTAKVHLRKTTSTLGSLLTGSIEVLRKRKAQSQNDGLCSDYFPSCRNLLLSRTHTHIHTNMFGVSVPIKAISHDINKLWARSTL